MKQLAEAVDAMIQKLPAEQAAEVAEDFGKLADEAVKPKPNQKWYSVSIEGLIKAAENLDKVGEPVIEFVEESIVPADGRGYQVTRLPPGRRFLPGARLCPRRRLSPRPSSIDPPKTKLPPAKAGWLGKCA